MRVAFVGTLALLALEGTLLFAPAGRLDWPMAWAFLATHGVISIAGFALLDPDLIRERLLPTPGFDRRDAAIATTSAVLMIALPLVVAGLDIGRWHASPPLPSSWRGSTLGIFALGQGLAVWAARCNRFFSDFVRIQSERGHQVVSSGPYRWVRHPGYAGWLVSFLAAPMALGSLYGLIPALLGALVLAARIPGEERILREGLPGYRDYAARVRFRLLPGVW